MKRKLLKFLPLMAAMILAASCGNNDKDPVTPQPTPGNDTPAQTSGEETVTVPFSVKVSNGNSLTKSGNIDQSIFNTEDESRKTMIITSPDNDYSDVKGELNLTSEDGLYYFEGSLSCNVSNMGKLIGGDIKLIGTCGTALEKPASSNVSFDNLLTNCNRLFKSNEFKYNSDDLILTLTDQNTYLEITMSKTQFTLDVKSGGDEAAAVTCELNEDGQVWVAVPSGTPLQVGSFLTKKSSELEPGVKHTINRSNLVDVGIPNILWADHNIGATNPWDYGDYYAWGETTTKTDYKTDWSNYEHWNNGAFTKYTTASGDGKPDLETLEKGDDVANVKDKTQSMPSAQDFQDLKDNCYWEWTSAYKEKTTTASDNQTYAAAGFIVYKAKSSSDAGLVAYYGEQQSWQSDYTTSINGYTLKDTHIFIPAAGYRNDADLSDPGEYGDYWSSSLYTDYPSNAHELCFCSDRVDPQDVGGRCFGYPVRAVRRSSGL